MDISLETLRQMPLKKVAEHVGIPYKTLWKRINQSRISFEVAIKTPLKKPFNGCSFIGCKEKHEARGLCNMHYLQWRRNRATTPRKKSKKGSGWTDKDGYKYFNKTREHIAIAESSLGRKLPKGSVVHHIDGDKGNNKKSNLLVCPSQSYHLLIHKRQRAIEASGNPDYLRCVFCKRYDSPDLMYSHRTLNYHRKCRNKHLKLKRMKK